MAKSGDHLAASASSSPKWARSIRRPCRVILTSGEAVEQWLTLPPKEALILQKPLPDGALRIVATDEKEDGLAAWPNETEFKP
jgi:hypothetical protein